VEVSSSAIDSLTPEQAIRTLGGFYDAVPAALWEDGEKPPPARLEKIAAQVRSDATPEARPVIDALLGAGNVESKGEVARVLLQRFAQNPELRRYIDHAAAEATVPHLFLDPLSVTALLAVFLLLSAKIKVGGFEYTGPTSNILKAIDLKGIAHELPEVLKAIPEGILRGFFK
jgi:hypothetical protein